MKAYVILPNGHVQETKLDPNEDWDALRQIIGGDIELVAVLYNKKPATMFVDEAGAPRQKQPNPRATALYWTATIQGVTGIPFDPLKDPMIYGTVVLFEVDKRTLQ